MVHLGIIGAEYMPQTDEGSFRISIQLPVGTNIDQSNIATLTSGGLSCHHTRSYQLFVKCLTVILGVLLFKWQIEKIAVEPCGRSLIKFGQYLKVIYRRQLSQVSETQSSVAGVTGGGGSGSGPNTAPVQIEAPRRKTLEPFAKASYRMQDIWLKCQVSKISAVLTPKGCQRYELYVDREKLKFYNTTVDQVNNVFNSAIAGGLAGYYANDPTNDGQDTDIYVRLKGSDGYKASDIRSIPVLQTIII